MPPALERAEAKAVASASVAISIKRDKPFDQDVARSFADLPARVTVVPASPTLKKGEAEARVSLKAADDDACKRRSRSGSPANSVDSGR